MNRSWKKVKRSGTYNRKVQRDHAEFERNCQAEKERILSQLNGRRSISNNIVFSNVIVEPPQHAAPTPYAQSPIVEMLSTDNNDEFSDYLALADQGKHMRFDENIYVF